MHEIRVNFRDRGWRWRLPDYGTLELWEGPTLVMEISGELAVRIFLHYREGHELVRAVNPRPPAPAPVLEHARPALRNLRSRRLRRAA
jgi:hypothetical protein